MVEHGPFKGKPLGEPVVAGSNPACGNSFLDRSKWIV